MNRRSKALIGLVPFTFLAHHSNLMAITQPLPNLSEKAKLLLSGSVIRPEVVDAPMGFRSHNFAGDHLLQVDQLTGSPRVMSGKLWDDPQESQPVNERSVLKAATDFLKQHSVDFGVSFDNLVLDQNSLLIDSDVQFVKYRVMIDGVQLLDGSIDLQFKKGQLVQVINHSYGEATAPQWTSLVPPSIDQARSIIERDAAELILVDTVVEKAAYWRVRQNARGYEKVKVQRYQVVDQGDNQYFVDIDLGRQEVMTVTPRQVNYAGHYGKATETSSLLGPLARGQATGDIYPRWYKDEIKQVGLPKVMVSAGTQNVTTDQGGSFALTGETPPKIAGFKGSLVKVKPTTGTLLNLEGVLTDNEWQITYKKGTDRDFADKNMAQAMAYVHTQKIIDYAGKYVQSKWLQKPLSVNVNLGQTCNAYWDGTTTNFYSAGGRCANTALIADVVYHEWGHGFDENTGGIEDGAFSEGFGDIMSILMTESNILGIGFFTDGKPVRDLEPNKVYPKDRGEVHAEGLIIGSTFWDLYMALKAKYNSEKAVDLLSQYSLKSVFTASRYTDVYKAVLVIDDNDQDPTNGTPNFCEINQVFTDHGLAKKSPDCKSQTTES